MIPLYSALVYLCMKVIAKRRWAKRGLTLAKYGYTLYTKYTEVWYYVKANKSALDEEIASALYKWRMAAAYYESAKDGDLMEYAIYELEAAKRRYTYLLRLKRNGA